MSFRFSLVIIGIICAIYYAYMVPDLCPEYCPDAHQQIVDNEFTSPWNYRILFPLIANYLLQSGIVKEVFDAYTAIHFVLFPLTLLTLYEWLRLSTSPERAFGACIMFAFFIPLIFLTNYGIGVWSTAEVFFFCMSFILLQASMPRNIRLILIAIITILASLNRSTAIFIPIAYGLVYIDLENLFDKRTWLEVIILGVCCVGTLFLVRWVRGPAEPMVAFPDSITRSIQDMGGSLITNFLLLPFWLPALSRRRYMTPFLKKLIWLLPLYLLAFLLFGIWTEIRLWMPMFPLLLAIIFSNERNVRNNKLTGTT